MKQNTCSNAGLPWKRTHAVTTHMQQQHACNSNTHAAIANMHAKITCMLPAAANTHAAMLPAITHMW